VFELIQEAEKGRQGDMLEQGNETPLFRRIRAYTREALVHQGSFSQTKMLEDLVSKFNISSARAKHNLERFLLSTLQPGEIGVCISGDNVVMRDSDIVSKWRGTKIGDRLAKAEEMKARFHLAEQVVETLAANRHITSLLLSSGASCYAVCDVLLRQPDLAIGAIYSNSLLVHDCFFTHNRRDIRLKHLGGEFKRDTGSLSDDFERQLKGEHCMAAVVAFAGLWLDGLYVGEDWEVRYLSKLMQLGPTCEMVIIPMIADTLRRNACAPLERLDGGFPEDYGPAVRCREYYLATNLREGEGDEEQTAIIKNWKERGGKVLFSR
jgi:DeoR/GlpR family transcriptional regulator of sugar metabolism